MISTSADQLTQFTLMAVFGVLHADRALWARTNTWHGHVDTVGLLSLTPPAAPTCLRHFSSINLTLFQSCRRQGLNRIGGVPIRKTPGSLAEKLSCKAEDRVK